MDLTTSMSKHDHSYQNMQTNLKSLQDKIKDLETKLNKVGTSEESQSFAISNNDMHSVLQSS